MKNKKILTQYQASIRSKNRALLWVLLSLCILFYGIAIVRIQGS